MAVEDIRKLTRGITSEIISSLGLCAAIEKTVADIRKVSSMQVNFVPEKMIEPPVNDKFKLNLFRIVQEQLNNILKHAQAKIVDIHLTTTNNTVMLQIKDDGVGFDMNIKQQGVGIGNIKNRAATYNGTASFISTPGNGCVLNVSVPADGFPGD
jgi:signal transduction histidine kinase